MKHTRQKSENESVECLGRAAKYRKLSHGGNLPVTTLLDLPQELLIEIFVLSANAYLPTTCKYLYEALCANPRSDGSADGPPLWMQHKFIRNSNPTLAFAIQKCLRRRFFSAETFKAYLPELNSLSAVASISIPLRCILRASESTRELLLYTELFLHGITLSDKSRNKALIYLAGNQSKVDPESLFWRSTKHDEFEKSAVLQAFKIAAKKRFFDRNQGMFDFLVRRFGIDENVGHELYDTAARKRDQELIATLRHYRVSPGMDALKLMTA